MRLLVLLALLECAIGAPRHVRQTPLELANIPPQALNTPPEQFLKHALFIPRGQEPNGFDPTKPIQGAFFISGDAQHFNIPPQFRLPQRQLPQTRPPAVALPTPESAVAHGTAEQPTPTTSAPSIPLAIQERQSEQLTDSLAAARPVPLAPAVVEELVTTTEMLAPTLPIAVEQSTAAPASPQPLPPIDPNLPPVDKSVDLDGDGRLSLPEVQYAAFVHHGLSGTVVQGMFNEVDHNKDGFLNSLEFNDIRALVLAKAENAAQRYLQSVDTDKNKLLSLEEAQAYILREHGIGYRDVERVWKLVLPDTSAEMDAAQFSKLRRRIRGMTIRLARQIMKIADTNGDGHISLGEAQAIAFEQEGIGAGDVAQMFASVDDNNDGELNAPEFADFERIVRARAVETSKKALRVVDTDGSNTLTMDEAKRIAFEHYGFDENILAPFFDQADENEDGHLDAVEFAGFRSVIRSRAVRNAIEVLKELDRDGDGLISLSEAEEKTRREDDMEPHETATLFNIADQNKSGKLDKVELADFIRLVRLSAIRFATEHFKEFDANRDRLVTVDELAQLIETKYHVPFDITKEFFEKVDIDGSGDLIPAEIVDFRHEIRKYVSKHPSASVVEQDDDRQLAEIVEAVVTTTLAPITTTTTTMQSTTRSTTKRRSTRRRPTTTTEAPPTSVEQITQTNGIDEFVAEPDNFEAGIQSEDSFDDNNNVDKPSTRATKVWKPRKNSATQTTTSTAASQAPITIVYTTRRAWATSTELSSSQSTTAAAFETPRTTKRRWTTSTTTEEPTTTEATTTTTRRTTRTTSTRTTTAEPSTTIPITTEPSTTTGSTTTATRATPTTQPRLPTTLPAEEFEYEIVEVEVDENGNEIVSEKIDNTVKTAPVAVPATKNESGPRRNPENKRGEQYYPEEQSDPKAKLQKDRKKLVDAQKRALNLPPDTEVEYVDGDTTSKPDEYDEEADYLEKEVQHS